MTLTEFKAYFDPHLDTAIREQITKYRSITHDETLHYYLAHIQKLAMDGGKRARPYIAWLSYKSFGGKKDAEIMPILLAIEIFHLFCLVQDDITDRGLTRHGVPTEHMVVADYLQTHNRLGDYEHAGDNMAMLVGDLLSAHANELFFHADLEPHIYRDVLTEFQATTNQVILGQMLDLDLMTRHKVDTATIATKHALKTSGYTFVSPLKLGAALAGQLAQRAQWCEALGYATGAIYQLQDDMLDITCLKHSSEKKTAGNDLRDGQHTFFTQYIWEHGSEEDKETLKKFFRHDFTSNDYPEIIRLFSESGALDAARQEIKTKSDCARTELKKAGLPAEYHTLWSELITFLEKRV